MTYEATWESIALHRVPNWYDDAKLGIFIHWGLYSVPGWAPRVPDIQTILQRHPPRWLFANIPYAEWYANTMRIDGSPTQRHHAECFGSDVPYDAFVPTFDAAASQARLQDLADLCQEAGARYVVLTSKHSDGYCLWPASTVHPIKGRYHSGRDLVGDLGAAVRHRQLRFGLYYSGGYDWPFNNAVIRTGADAILASPYSEAYARYADRHVRELIDRYQPSILWNDISWPARGDLPSLFAYYYNTVEEGVLNDRWFQPSLPRGRIADAIVRAAGFLLEQGWGVLPRSSKELKFPAPRHYDFSTPEYMQPDKGAPGKWEATRGIGHSFGANRHEAPENVMSSTELVRSFVRIVANNGNLLIGIGPEPDGTIPGWQRQPLLALGKWLATNGAAIYGSRPWETPSAVTNEGGPLSFTLQENALYAMLTEAPTTQQIQLPVDGSAVREVHLLGVDEPLPWKDDGRLTVTLPDRVPLSPVHTLRISPVPRPIVTASIVTAQG